MQMNKTDLIKMVAEKANKPTKEVAEKMCIRDSSSIIWKENQFTRPFFSR